MGQLNDEQKTALIDALIDAFSYDGLELMLARRFNKPLEHYSLARNYPSVVLALVQATDREYWADALAVAAHDANRNHPALRRLAEDLLVLPERDDRPVLEAQLSKYYPFLDATTWRLDMADQEPRVCKISAQTKDGYEKFGTGFLVGADLVMTAGHVVENVDPVTIRLLFDYRVVKKGDEPLDGVEYRVRTPKWLLASSPKGDLDFALLHVEGAPGNDPIGKKVAEPGAPKRGSMVARKVDPAVYTKDRPVLILQHPEGEPLKLVWKWESVIELQPKLLRHQTSTKGGSSGSPVFDEQWNVIAVHTGTTGNKNHSVPIGPILDAIADQKVALK